MNTIYVIYNRTCGHVIGAPNARWMADKTVSAGAAKGQFDWRIRAGATDAEIESLLRGEHCRQDAS